MFSSIISIEKKCWGSSFGHLASPGSTPGTCEPALSHPNIPRAQILAHSLYPRAAHRRFTKIMRPQNLVNCKGSWLSASPSFSSCPLPLLDYHKLQHILWAPSDSAAASAKRTEIRRAAPLSCLSGVLNQGRCSRKLKQLPALSPTRYKTSRL